MHNQTQSADRGLSLRRLIGLCISARLLLDTGIQTFNPFLPLIASGLGVDIVTLGRMLGLQNLVGLASPVLGIVAERQGYRWLMRLSLGIGGLGFLLVATSQHLIWAALGLLLIGFCVAGFIPTLVAYLSARLPYERRARGIGTLEYSWALSGIVGIFIVSQLIAVAGWRAPFWGIGIGLLIMSLVFARLPAAPADSSPSVSSGPAPDWRVRFRQFLALGPNARSAYTAMMASGCNFIALMQLNLSYGAWLSGQYGIGARELGWVALFFGLLDLCASVSVSLFTDQLGKRRSLLIGASGALMGYALLPMMNVGLLPAVIGLGLARGFAEFFLVSMLSLLSEQVPERRARVMTLNTATMQISSAIAGFVGPWLFVRTHVVGLSISGTFLLAAAIGLIVFWVRERQMSVGGLSQ